MATWALKAGDKTVATAEPDENGMLRFLVAAATVESFTIVNSEGRDFCETKAFAVSDGDTFDVDLVRGFTIT